MRGPVSRPFVRRSFNESGAAKPAISVNTTSEMVRRGRRSRSANMQMITSNPRMAAREKVKHSARVTRLAAHT